MKKVCMITTVSLTMRSFVVATAEYLHNECGYDITLICNEDKEFAASLPEYIHFTPVSMARGIDFSAFSSIRQFIKIFKQERFDLVQYSTPNASCYASIAAKICRVPVRLYCQWGIRYVGFGGVKRKIFKLIEKFVCNNSTHIRAVSPMNKDFAVSEKLYSAERAKVVGKGGTIGVDMSAYDISKKQEWRTSIREKNKLGEDDFVFGFAGRISVDKGCGELFSAFKSVCEEAPESKLLIVGPLEGKSGVDEGLIAWAETSPNVVFTGKVQNADMRMYYAAMDTLVHPTYREGFGMVIQEAGALAVPSITTRIAGASEVMTEDVSCLLAEPKNSAELAEKMLLLATDREKNRELGLAAYRRTEEFFARPIMLENQRADYEELIEGKKNEDRFDRQTADK